uniref:Fibronectin type-III domain-containing protein n=1 Tax=Anguilla anguilla TaxID=7936 RepID=A0A0E9TZD5_ANGAN
MDAKGTGKGYCALKIMNYVLIAIFFLQCCCQVLAALPTPVNITVESVNFEHSLRWDPGLERPPGTTYRVRYR